MIAPLDVPEKALARFSKACTPVPELVETMSVRAARAAGFQRTFSSASRAPLTGWLRARGAGGFRSCGARTLVRPGLLESGGLLLRPCEDVVVVDGRRHAREALAPVFLVECEREFDRACESLDIERVARECLV